MLEVEISDRYIGVSPVNKPLKMYKSKKTVCIQSNRSKRSLKKGFIQPCVLDLCHNPERVLKRQEKNASYKCRLLKSQIIAEIIA